MMSSPSSLRAAKPEKNLPPIEAKGCSWMKEVMSGSQNTSRTQGLELCWMLYF